MEWYETLGLLFALLVVVWLWPHVKRRELRYLMLAYPVSMLLSLVYLAEHYVTDVLAGWAAVGLSFVVWSAGRSLKPKAMPSTSVFATSETPSPSLSMKTLTCGGWTR